MRSAVARCGFAGREAIEILRDLVHEATSPVKDARRADSRALMLILISIPLLFASLIWLLVELWRSVE
jgi:hypothetical protein